MKRVSTGVLGLDEVLAGGLPAQRTYLVRGGPGTGKTTLGLHFLTASHTKPGKSMLITFGESGEQIRANANLLEIDLKGVEILDLSPSSQFFSENESYDIFSPAEVERAPLTHTIIDAVDRIKPERVFIDAMTQMKYLAADLFQFHKQTLSFLRYLTDQGATVVFTSENSPQVPDADLQFLSDGVITLADKDGRLNLTVSKFRGSDFARGEHTYTLSDKGALVFPRLIPALHSKSFDRTKLPSGVPELDEMTAGGFERGTCVIFTGPSGVGKTTLGMQYMKEAAGRGVHSAVYLFDESIDICLNRCRQVQIPADLMLEKGDLKIRQINALETSADELAVEVRRDVEENDTQIVMIDSVRGYQLALGKEKLDREITSLIRYLTRMGVTVFITNEVEKITGDFQVTEVGISYVADSIVFLRYLEIDGEIRKAIGILKNRLSEFQRTLREFEITRYGIKVGRPLSNLRGLLSGTPQWIQEPGERS